MSFRFATTALVLGLIIPAFAGSDLSDDVSRVDHASSVFHEIMQTPDKAVPKEILQNAHCIAIVPGEKNFAIGFGGTYGKGVATCRDDGAWSAPMFIQVGGGSWGLQLGGQSTDVIMIFRTRRGLESLLSDKVKIGGGVSAAAGPVGRNASGSTDAAMNAEILTYARSRGLFAGISLDGDIVQPDDSGDSAMYPGAAWKTILSGSLASPASTRGLLTTLDLYSARAKK